MQLEFRVVTTLMLKMPNLITRAMREKKSVKFLTPGGVARE